MQPARAVSQGTHPWSQCSFPSFFLYLDYCSSVSTAQLLKKKIEKKKTPQPIPQITEYNVLKLGLIIKGLSSPLVDRSRIFCLGTGKWTKFSKFLHVLACVWLPESVPHHLYCILGSCISMSGRNRKQCLRKNVYHMSS